MNPLRVAYDAVTGYFKPPTEPADNPVKRLMAAAQASQPDRYAWHIDRVNAYYRSCAEPYVKEALLEQFPEDAPKMRVVQLKVLPCIINEQSRVFAGDGKYELVDAKGRSVVEAGGVKWADVLDDGKGGGAQWSLKSLEINRLATANRLLFGRFDWNTADGCVRITLFTPDKVFFELTDDVRDVEHAPEVLLELAPVLKDGERQRRFEYWTRGVRGPDGWLEAPRCAILALDGEVLRESEQGNPYRGPDGRALEDPDPIIPIVAFRTTDPDGSPWPLPDQGLLNAAETINADLTNLKYVGKLGAFGQWKAQTSDPSPEPWPPKIARGPGKVMKIPRGWDVEHVAQDAPLAELDASNASYVRQVTAMERLPPGSVLSEARQVPSGIALQLERAPLTELRQDQILLFRPAVHRALNLIRIIWNAHQGPVGGRGGDATRFLNCTPRWTPGDMRLPPDPEAQARTDDARIRAGTWSPVRSIMRDEGLSLEAATKRAGEYAAENRVRVAASMADAGRALPGRTEPPARPTLDPEQLVRVQALVKDVVAGDLPRDTALALLEVSFGIAGEAAQRVLGDAGMDAGDAAAADAQAGT